jgi:threonine/homoserine/homoserine lactone efflux protein
MEFFLKGLLLGFSIAAPVGPIGLLCIRRTLAEGKVSGFVSGLGAATADALYGCVAAFGLTAVSAVLVNYKQPLQLAGGLFLIYLALQIFLSKPADTADMPAPRKSFGKAYASTLFLTLANPATILSFVAVFAGLGIVGTTHAYTSPALMVAGVFLGSAAWWLALSGGVGLFKDRLHQTGLIWVNRVSGILIFVLAMISLAGIR